MTQLELRMLGHLEVLVDGTRLHLTGPRERFVVIRLALNPNRPVNLDTLAHDVWEEFPPPSAAASLRVHVSRLRKTLAAAGAGDRVLTRSASYMVRLEHGERDIDRFDDMVRAGRDARAAGSPDDAAALLRGALELWRGPALADVAGAPFARGESGRLEEARLVALEDRLEAELECGRHASLVGELEALCVEHELRERLWAARIVALYRSGRQAAALRAYQELRSLLAESLGIVPSPALRMLEQAVLEQDASLDLLGTVPAAASSAPAPGAVEDPPDADWPPPLPPALMPRDGDVFVGRDEPLSHLGALWSKTFEGSGSSVFLVGEPGIGKTTLASEIARRAHQQGSLVLYGRCDEGLGAPYQPFVEAVRACVITVDDSVLEAHVAVHGGELARLVPELDWRVKGLRPPTAADPDTERYRMFEAVVGLLAEVGRRQPVVLVLDDLHWADRATILLVRHVVRSAGGTRVLLVGTYRQTEVGAQHPVSEVLSELFSSGAAQRSVLHGLDGTAVEQLVDAAGQDVALAPALFRETAGNPFFLTELLRHQADADATLPHSIREAVGRRLARIAPETYRALSVAAVVGPSFSLAVLERVPEAADTSSGLLDALDEGVLAGVVIEDDVPARYRFTHELIRQTLLVSTSTTRRAHLHRQVAGALESLGNHDARLEELAYHWMAAAPLGDASQKALGYAMQAAERALRSLAFEKAGGHYEQALEVLELADTHDDDVRCGLLLELGRAQRRSGEPGDAIESLRRAAAVARHHGMPDRFGWIAIELADAHQDAHDFASVAESRTPLLEEALAMLSEEDSELRARLLGALSQAAHMSTDHDRSQHEGQLAIAMARRLGDARVLAEVLADSISGSGGRHGGSARLALAGELLEIATSVHARTGEWDGRQPGELALQAHRWRIWELLINGDVAAADVAIEAHRGLAMSLRQPLQMGHAETIGALRAHMDARWDDSRRHAQAALEHGKRAQNLQAPNFFTAQIFQLAIERGELSTELSEAADLALAAAPNVSTVRAGAAWVLCQLGAFEAARAELGHLAPDRFAALRDDYTWTSSMVMMAAVCASLEEAEHAGVLYELLLPYDGQLILSGPPPILCWGPAALHLGRLASTAGDLDAAASHLEQARAQASRMGITLQLHVSTAYAELLTKLGRDDEAAELALEVRERAAHLEMKPLVERASAVLELVR